MSLGVHGVFFRSDWLCVNNRKQSSKNRFQLSLSKIEIPH